VTQGAFLVMTASRVPDVAAAVLDFVSEAVRGPAAFKAACQAFANHPSSKGLQAGFLSPILNALRPEDYRIVNRKTRVVLKEFIGEEYSRGIIKYPDSNEAAGRLVAAIRELRQSGRVADALDCDLADAFFPRRRREGIVTPRRQR
jgi:5-methylcytosine-specific restriction enzyme B